LLAVAAIFDDRQNGHAVGADGGASGCLDIGGSRGILSRNPLLHSIELGIGHGVPASSVRAIQRVVPLHRITAHAAEQLSRWKRGDLLEMTARATIGRVSVDGGDSVSDRHETDESLVTSRAANRRLFVDGWNELHQGRSDRMAVIGLSARALQGHYSNAGWLKIADALNYTPSFASSSVPAGTGVIAWSFVCGSNPRALPPFRA